MKNLLFFMSCLCGIHAGIQCEITTLAGEQKVIELPEDNIWFHLREACMREFNLQQPFELIKGETILQPTDFPLTGPQFLTLVELIKGETILQPTDFPLTGPQFLTPVSSPSNLMVGLIQSRAARSGPRDEFNYEIRGCYNQNQFYIKLVQDFLDTEAQSFLNTSIQEGHLDLEQCNGNLVFNRSDEDLVQEQYEVLNNCIFVHSGLNDLDTVYDRWVYEWEETDYAWLLKITINGQVFDFTKSVLQAILAQKGKPLEERLVPLKTILSIICNTINDKTTTSDPMLLAREIGTNMEHAFVG